MLTIVIAHAQQHVCATVSRARLQLVSWSSFVCDGLLCHEQVNIIIYPGGFDHWNCPRGGDFEFSSSQIPRVAPPIPGGGW